MAARPYLTLALTTLRLHDYAASANCYKVRLLLAQLERPCERVPVDIFAGETLGEEYRAMNPTRETPVLELADGRFLPDSGAILVYLAESTPLLPAAAYDRAQVVRWLIYEQTEVIPGLGGLRFRLLTGRLAPDDGEAVRRRQGGEKTLRLLDAHLAAEPFFVAGRYSVADIAMYGYVHVAGEAGIALEPYANVSAWLARVEAQPRFMNDLEPYPPNARAGAGRSQYD
jgi:glutathione S-transferase